VPDAAQKCPSLESWVVGGTQKLTTIEALSAG